ncbi:NIPSNAP family protein [Oceanobacillus saliphilus]|uniref:NIPSNAP family protein n=1 Tax=Oceanobacillus saliphilus TaxID=2925834 RepID=UPI00201D9A52|nr:NIPSNAP family protein [Oceanobacillus saliphilus]
MIYELREYYIAPGKAAALHERFQRLTEPLFEKHEINVIGYWNVLIGEAPKLVYLCEFKDLAHREQSWTLFLNDPEWVTGRQKSEENGVLTLRIMNSIMTPTEYSALK